MLEPATHDLDQDELTALVADLAARPEAWQHLVTHRADARTYVELHRDEHVAVWLICWMNDHDTGYHDHDLSAGAVGVAAGAVREERLVPGPPPPRPGGHGGERVLLRPRGHPPRRPRRRRAGGDHPRLLAPAHAHGRLRGARIRRAPALVALRRGRAAAAR